GRRAAGGGHRARRAARGRPVRAGHGRRASAGAGGWRRPADRLRERLPGHRVRYRPGPDGRGPGPQGKDRVGRVDWREMKAVVAALLANLGIAITKFVAFLLTGSASMLAESVHSIADTGNEVLLLVGRGRSDRPRAEEHP